MKLQLVCTGKPWKPRRASNNVARLQGPSERDGRPVGRNLRKAGWANWSRAARATGLGSVFSIAGALSRLSKEGDEPCLRSQFSVQADSPREKVHPSPPRKDRIQGPGSEGDHFGAITKPSRCWPRGNNTSLVRPKVSL